ncbi:MAG: ATP-binding protein [Pelosinus sp.]|nr:ATP-binding protein [Pelosinus sp.]
MSNSPVQIKFKGYDGFNHIKGCITSYIRLHLPEDDFDFMEIAVHEAINNAIRHGNQSEKAWVTLKFRLIQGQKRDRLIIRIKDEGPGFAVNDQFDKISHYLDFQNTQQLECGRGLLIMMAAADYIVYNRVGNEVMLVKFLVKNSQDKASPGGINHADSCE